MRIVRPAPADEIRICVICSAAFTCRPNEWDYGFRHRPTCGKTCGIILGAQRRRRLSTRPCGHCQTPFTPRNWKEKSCSRPCYFANKKGRPATYIPPSVQRVLVACPWCLIMHPKRPKEIQGRNVFCSRPCYRKFQAQQHLGTHFPSEDANAFYLSAAWGRLKRAAKKRDAYTCQACLHIFDMHSPGMIVHHIRPRELFDTQGKDVHPVADDPQNLVTLCRGCHQKTHAGHFPRFLNLAA